MHGASQLSKTDIPDSAKKFNNFFSQKKRNFRSILYKKVYSYEVTFLTL